MSEPTPPPFVDPQLPVSDLPDTPVAAAPVSGGEFTPVREGERILTLDVLRGFAILGILFVNIAFFTMPMMHSFLDPALPESPLSEKLAWAFVHVFCQYKFVSLFSMLFGIGLVVQMTRAQQKGKPFGPMYFRRLIVLGLIGACHAFLLWYGDILMIYAFFGIFLFLMRGMSVRALLTTAAVLFVISVLFATGCMSLQLGFTHMKSAGMIPKQGRGTPAVQVDSESGAAKPDVASPVLEALDADVRDSIFSPPGDVDTPEMASTIDEEAADHEPASPSDEDPPRGLKAIMMSQGDPNREVWQTAETLAYKEGPFTDVLPFRMISYLFVVPAVILGFGERVLAMFLLGAALMKVRFFDSEHRSWHIRLVLLGLFVGLPMEVVGAWVRVATDFEFAWPMLITSFLHEIGSLFVCLGYVGAICLMVSSGLLRWFQLALASVGRMALSTYLGETILASFLMYWWGLAWFGEVTRVEQIGITLAIYASLVVFSNVWMRFFTIGPFEWLWRSLSYLRPQPIVRHGTGL